MITLGIVGVVSFAFGMVVHKFLPKSKTTPDKTEIK